MAALRKKAAILESMMRSEWEQKQEIVLSIFLS